MIQLYKYIYGGTNMRSNFEFVKEIDSELFDYLLDVEKKVKIEPFLIGNPLRHVLEKLCAIKIQKYNLKDDMIEELGKIPNLSEQMRLLRDGKNFIPRMKKKPGNESLTPLPSLRVSLEYRNKKGKKINRFNTPEKLTQQEKDSYLWADKFLRQIGNEFSHELDVFMVPVFARSYDNVVYALRKLQEYIILYYNLDKGKIPQFNEDFMPIANYEITGVCIPSDADRTSCQKEYTANRYEEYRTGSVGCSIIRQYPRIDNKANFLRRAPDVYLAGDNCGALLNKVTIISEGGQKDKPFYLVAYDFRTQAYQINNKFLSNLSTREKIELCLSYAQTMSFFHNNSSPIYHRIFSSKCAYYADERNKSKGISTAIIKFEYAKIADGIAETVIGNSPANIFNAKDDSRYIAPEWNSLFNPTSDDWAKVDIYSLGILFADILMGSIGGYIMSDIAKKSEFKSMLPLLQKMCTAAPGRPDINQVCSYIEEILKNEN